MKLEVGRPLDCENRLPKEIKTYDFLDDLGVVFQRVDHEALVSMHDGARVDALLEATISKNIFLCNKSKTKFYLLMIAGDKKFNSKDLSHALGVGRLSFAKEEYMVRYLDITPGSVSVMGLMNDAEQHVQLLIDRDFLKVDYMACHPCINTSSIRLKVTDLVERIVPALGHEPIFVDVE